MSKIIVCTQEELSSLIKSSLKEIIGGGIPPPKEELDIGDISLAQAVTGLKRQTIYKYCYEAKIPFIRVGRLLRFSKTDLIKWMRENGNN